MMGLPADNKINDLSSSFTLVPGYTHAGPLKASV